MTDAKAVSEHDSELKQSVLSALTENSTKSARIDSFNEDLESPFEEEVFHALTEHFDESKLIPQLQFAGFVYMVPASSSPNPYFQKVSTQFSMGLCLMTIFSRLSDAPIQLLWLASFKQDITGMCLSKQQIVEMQVVDCTALFGHNMGKTELDNFINSPLDSSSDQPKKPRIE